MRPLSFFHSSPITDGISFIKSNHCSCDTANKSIETYGLSVWKSSLLNAANFLRTQNSRLNSLTEGNDKQRTKGIGIHKSRAPRQLASDNSRSLLVNNSAPSRLVQTKWELMVPIISAAAMHLSGSIVSREVLLFEEMEWSCQAPFRKCIFIGDVIRLISFGAH